MMPNSKKVWRNKKQAKYRFVMPQIAVLFFGRATGKTHGPQTDFVLNNISQMPRSVGGFAGVTYESLLTKIIPGIVKSLESFNLIHEKHFFVRKKPPSKYKWAKAYRQVLKYENYISFYNGSGIQLLSLDKSMNNGTDLDWISYDEARFFKEDEFREVDLAVRGNLEFFGHLSAHHSRLFTSDRPRSATSNWLYDIAKGHKQPNINLIMAMEFKRHVLYEKLSSVQDPANKKRIRYKINEWDKLLNQARKGTVLYLEASTFDNAEILGLETIKNFKRTLSDLDFRISVLNERINQVEHGFYPALNEEHHTYVASNHSHISGLEYDAFNPPKPNCEWDSDHNDFLPLHIWPDWGASFNGILVGQEYERELRIINAICVLHPYLIKDLFAKFIQYYEPRKFKKVIFHYDHTAVGHDGKNEESYAQETARILKDAGWQVEEKYFGQAKSHDYRYHYVNKVLSEDPNAFGDTININLLPRITINRIRCAYLIKSLQNTAVKETRKGFEKDKSPERDKTLDQRTAPHFSDCFDLAITSMMERKTSATQGYYGSSLL